MPRQFDGKVALVTGGSAGIGKATAIMFAENKAKVVIAARRIKEGEETVEEIRNAGGEAIFVRADVSDSVEAEAMIRETVETYGRLDFAVNNAAARPHNALTHEYSVEAWQDMINVNLNGVWFCVKHEIAQMLSQGSGAIVNVSSGAGLIGVRNISSYAAAKHGVIGLTKSAALEYAREGIRINCVCPGYTLTPMLEPSYNNPERREFFVNRLPVGRVGTPEELAESILWLCSDASSFVTGIAMPVDGGLLSGQ